MITLIYRAIALLFLVFTAIDMYKEDAPSMKVNACMVMVPLLPVSYTHLGISYFPHKVSLSGRDKVRPRT